MHTAYARICVCVCGHIASQMFDENVQIWAKIQQQHQQQKNKTKK